MTPSSDRLYSARLSSSTTVVTAAGMPSPTISRAEAGWPPVAEGVMAEK